MVWNGKGVEGGSVGLFWGSKSWGTMMENMNLLRVEEHVAQNQQMWKAVIACPTLS